MGWHFIGHWWECCCCIPQTCQSLVFDERCNGVDFNSQPCADVTSGCVCPVGYDADGSINGLYPYASFGGNCENIETGTGRLRYFIWSGNSCQSNEDEFEWTQVRVCLTCGNNPNPGHGEEWLFVIIMEVEIPFWFPEPPHKRNNHFAWGSTWYPLDNFIIDENGIINGTGTVEIRDDGPGTAYYCDATAVLSAGNPILCPRP